MSGNSTTATWVIDNNPAQNFTLNGHEVNATTVYNQKFFETPVYPFGSHKLTVTYNGDNSKTPLVLGKLVIQNGTAVPSATGTTGTRATSSSSTHATSNHTPAIVGGVIGGVALLIVLSLVLFVLYRRRQKEKRIKVDETVTASDVLAPQIIPPTRQLPAKMTEGYSNFRPSQAGTRTDPSGISSVETATQSLIITNEQQSQNPSDSPESDSTNPSSLIVHQDSGARLPRVLPPAYTPD